MQYLITFLEGLITFISPCVLPLLPVYVLYFAGDGQRSTLKTFRNSLGFVAGFSVLFMFLGVFAGTLGGILTKYATAVNIVTGGIVVLFGLHYTGVLKFGILNKTVKPDAKIKPVGFFSSVLFGVVFAVGWSPCTGAFLGSAMMLASQQGKWFTGMVLLLCYSLGLGIPFILSAVLTQSVKNAVAFIGRHYKLINIIRGIFLIIIGVLMMTGVMKTLTALMK